MNNDLAYFLGLWIAEGSFEQKIGRCSITCGDSSVGDLLETGAVMGLKFKLSSGRADQWRVNSYELLELFKFLKMPLVNAPEKWLPDFLWSGTREIAQHVLSGMFDGDGYVCVGRNKVGYTTSSKQLAKDVQLLLTNFGVMSRLTAVESKPTARVKVTSVQYRVEIIGANASKLKDVLKLRIKRKAEALELIPDDLLSRRDGLPTLSLLEELKRACKGSKRGKLEEAINIAKRVGSDTTYPTLRHILRHECAHLAGTEAYDRLAKLVEDHYYWDEVVQVEKGESMTYDFTIPDTHSFWSNGFISHNTPKAYNQLYEVYQFGQDDSRKAWSSYQFPTITSPFIPESEIIEARRDMDPRTFRQEFEACHLPDTEVLLFNGSVKRICDVQIDDLLCHINPNGEIEACLVEAIGETGEKTICDAILETGEVVSASAHHKFKVHANA